jgi:hypothetical protein
MVFAATGIFANTPEAGITSQTADGETHGRQRIHGKDFARIGNVRSGMGKLLTLSLYFQTEPG